MALPGHPPSPPGPPPAGSPAALPATTPAGSGVSDPVTVALCSLTPCGCGHCAVPAARHPQLTRASPSALSSGVPFLTVMETKLMSQSVPNPSQPSCPTCYFTHNMCQHLTLCHVLATLYCLSKALQQGPAHSGRICWMNAPNSKPLWPTGALSTGLSGASAPRHRHPTRQSSLQGHVCCSCHILSFRSRGRASRMCPQVCPRYLKHNCTELSSEPSLQIPCYQKKA